jgi:hypothetical protein
MHGQRVHQRDGHVLQPLPNSIPKERIRCDLCVVGCDAGGGLQVTRQDFPQSPGGLVKFRGFARHMLSPIGFGSHATLPLVAAAFPEMLVNRAWHTSSPRAKEAWHVCVHGLTLRVAADPLRTRCGIGHRSVRPDRRVLLR